MHTRMQTTNWTVPELILLQQNMENLAENHKQAVSGKHWQEFAEAYFLTFFPLFFAESLSCGCKREM